MPVTQGAGCTTCPSCVRLVARNRWRDPVLWRGVNYVHYAQGGPMSTPPTTRAAERPGPLQALAPLLDRLGGAPIIGPLAGLLLLIVAFSILSPVFFTTGNFSQVF